MAFKSSRISGSVLCSSLAFGLPVSVCLSSLPLSLSSFPSGANHPSQAHFGVSWSLLLPPDPLVSPRFSFPVVTTKSSSPSHLPPTLALMSPPSHLFIPLLPLLQWSWASHRLPLLGRQAWQQWRSPMDDSRACASLGAVTKEITHHRLKFKLEFR